METARKDLTKYNSFGIKTTSDSFISIRSESQLIDLIESAKLSGKKILVLGGGSNILFVNDFEGYILHPEMKEISINYIDDNTVSVSCGAGTDWDGFVNFCVGKNFGGLENLSYIPGSVGASPIQNIGAYGAEVKDSIESVRAVNLSDGSVELFSNEESDFAYRSSIFKTSLAGKFLITSVTFRLNCNPTTFNLSYGMLEDRVNSLGKPSLKTVRDAVIQIRKEKLPEPEIIGNAGSFFKNPIISASLFSKIRTMHPDMPYYNTDTEMVKLPAAWLIEKCGWKGYRKGDAGVHVNQALVLVNYGTATGKEILDLSEEIISSVNDKFGILLTREVNLI